MPFRFVAWLVAAVLNRPTGGFVVSCRANTPMRLCRHCRHLPGIGMSAWTPEQQCHGIVTLTFVRQPEVRDDFAAHITLRFGRTCPAARH